MTATPLPSPPPPHLKVWIDHCVPSVVVRYYAEIWTVKQHKFLLHSHVSTETEQEKPTCISYIFQTDNFLFHRRKYSIPREKFYNQIQQNFVDFNQLSYTELIIKLMNSQLANFCLQLSSPWVFTVPAETPEASNTDLLLDHHAILLTECLLNRAVNTG